MTTAKEEALAMTHSTPADRYHTIYLSWEDPGGDDAAWVLRHSLELAGDTRILWCEEGIGEHDVEAAQAWALAELSVDGRWIDLYETGIEGADYDEQPEQPGRLFLLERTDG